MSSPTKQEETQDGLVVRAVKDKASLDSPSPSAAAHGDPIGTGAARQLVDIAVSDSRTHKRAGRQLCKKFNLKGKKSTRWSSRTGRTRGSHEGDDSSSSFSSSSRSLSFSLSLSLSFSSSSSSSPSSQQQQQQGGQQLGEETCKRLTRENQEANVWIKDLIAENKEANEKIEALTRDNEEARKTIESFCLHFQEANVWIKALMVQNKEANEEIEALTRDYEDACKTIKNLQQQKSQVDDQVISMEAPRSSGCGVVCSTLVSSAEGKEIVSSLDRRPSGFDESDGESGQTHQWQTTPTGKAGGDSDHFDFSLPHDKVLQLAVDFFGHGASDFSSKRWERRVQALKNMGSVLKSLDASAKSAAPAAAAAATAMAPGGQRPGAANPETHGSGEGRGELRCFRAACLVLNIALGEKVPQVHLEANSFLLATLEYGTGKVSAEEAKLAIATLLDHPLTNLGNMNPQLHEQACATFVLCCGQAPRLPLRLALKKLAGFLKMTPVQVPHRMRLHAGVLDCAGLLARRFSGRGEGDEVPSAAGATGVGGGEGGEEGGSTTWSAEDLRPFVAAAAAIVDPELGARVHQAAAALSFTVYTKLGRKGLSVVIAETPGHFKELVLNKIEEDTGTKVGSLAPQALAAPAKITPAVAKLLGDHTLCEAYRVLSGEFARRLLATPNGSTQHP